MPADGPAIKKRYLKGKEARYNFDDRWETMAPLIAPSRVGIITRYEPGDDESRGVYDSTMMAAAEMMANFIAGECFNPGQVWGSMHMAHPRVKDSKPVAEWLEECRDRMLAARAASSFYAEAPEMLVDYGGFGTGCLIVEERPQPEHLTLRGFRGLHYETVKIGRFVIADGSDGLVDTLMRERKLTARVAADRWGEDQMPWVIRKALDEGKGDTPFTFLHAVQPRPKAEQGAGSKGMPWASVWLELETAEVVSEGGFRSFNAAVPRYERTPGEVYGRGRGDLAFPDAWTLNAAKRLSLEDWPMKIRPPILGGSDSVFGTLRIHPGAFTPINLRGRSIRDVILPFDTGSKPEVSQIKEEELRQSIREIFFVDSIRQLLTVNKSEMTAFEYAKKIELLYRLMGPVYGRMRREFLSREWDITFDLMLEGGAFSPPPPEVYESDGKIEVGFENPLERAQKTGGLEALALALQDLGPYAQIDPGVLERIDSDKASKYVCETRGVPARILRTDDELTERRAEQKKQQQNAAALQEAHTVSEMAKNVAPLHKAMRQPAGTAA